MDDETKKLIELDLFNMTEPRQSMIRLDIEEFAQRLRNAMYGEDYYRGAAQPYGRSKDAV